MNSLEKAKKYAETNIPKSRKSKLDKHYEAIQLLRNQGFTINQILDFLQNEVKIKVGYTTLQHFIKSRFENNIEKIKPTPPSKLETKKPKNQEKKWGQKTYVVENQTRSKRLNIKELESQND